jgi:predicted nucleotidyltransferase component of viral defense system
MLLQEIKDFTGKLRAQGLGNDYIINCLKEFLQVRVLEFLYNNKKYNQKLIFTGGTCLRLCFNLPRLSEDLDFDYEGILDVEELKLDLFRYFSNSLKIENFGSVIKGKNKKIYLKFPILKESSLAYKESDILYLKIETELIKDVSYKTEISTINRDGLYFYLKRYSLPDLMSGKINAFLTRTFNTGKKNKIDFKGRDVFDLIWFIGQNINPNKDRLKMMPKGTKYEKYSWLELLEEIKTRIINIRKEHLILDLKNFIENQNVFNGFIENYLLIFEQYYKLAVSN